MFFKAQINIMPLESLLDPQGKAVSQNIDNIGLSTISNVRIGKSITLKVEAENETQAKEIVTKACKSLLCNMIIESFEFTLTKP